MKNLLYIYILFFALSSFSQKKSEKLPLDEYTLVKVGDTLMIELDGFTVLPKHKFKSTEDIRYYFWFKRKVFKAYPYARLAGVKLDSLNNSIANIAKKRDKKRAVKKMQKFMEGEFTDQIKKMTRTEGRILIKLIHRQTGKTVFNNIKEYRSGWKAFWYNTTANVFSLSLKQEYDPSEENEDYLIEDVLQRAFNNDRLKYEPSKLSFDFSEISRKNKGKVNVEKYKKMFSKKKKKSATKDKTKKS